MIVLADTSVWIDLFNARGSGSRKRVLRPEPQFNEQPSIEARTLARLIEDGEAVATCGVIVAEFFRGLRGQRSVAELRRLFLDLDYFEPREPESYLAAADLFRALRRKGVTVRSTIDCLICQLASENDAHVLAKDRDMRQILASGLCRARAAPLVS